MVRPKLGYGDVGLQGQRIYAAESTGREGELVVLTQTENGNSQLRTSAIEGDGATNVGRRVDSEFRPDFTALDLASNQTLASAVLGTSAEEIEFEDENDFDDLTDAQQKAIEEEPFHPYGIPTITTAEIIRPASTTTLTDAAIDVQDGLGVLAGRTKLGSVSIEVILRPDGEEGDHLNQLDVVIDGFPWTLTTDHYLLGTAAVHARGSERPFIVADTEDRELLVWQAGDNGWNNLVTLEDAEPNTARLSKNGELVAWRTNDTVLEPVVLRDQEWKPGDNDQRQPADSGAIPVRNGEVWLTTDTNGAVKAIDVEPG